MIKKHKWSLGMLSMLILSLIIRFLYPIFSDTALGDAKDWLSTKLPFLKKSMPPEGWTLLILFLFFVIIFTYEIWAKNGELEDKITQLEEDNQTKQTRIDSLIDKGVTKPIQIPSINFTSNRSDIYLSLFKKMEVFTKNNIYINGVQLYEYTFKTGQVSFTRKVEFVDNVSSWEGATFKFPQNLYNELKNSIRSNKVSEFVNKYQIQLNTKRENIELDSEVVSKYAFYNVGKNFLDSQQAKPRIANYKLEQTIMANEKRVGIFEAAVFISCTSPTSGYIFEKKSGDRDKWGRIYLCTIYKVDGRDHILLITFDKAIKSFGKQYDQEIKELSVKLMEFLENH